MKVDQGQGFMLISLYVYAVCACSWHWSKCWVTSSTSRCMIHRHLSQTSATCADASTPSKHHVMSTQQSQTIPTVLSTSSRSAVMPGNYEGIFVKL